MTKINVPRNSVGRLLYPKLTVLLTSVNGEGEPNIITLGCAMPTSFNPPIIAVSIGTSRFSHDLVEDSSEFVVNVPTRDILNEVMFCGSKSGISTDKFGETGLTPIRSEEVTPPRIGECVAHLECKVVGKIRTGDHTVFAGEVVASSADEGVFDEESNALDLGRVEPLYHVGENYFATMGKRFEVG